MNAETTIFVTGGAGFIDANFVHTWLETFESTLVNLDKLTYAGNLENLEPLAKNPNHIFVKGDIGNRQLVAKLLDQFHPRAIVNFAAESHVDRSISAPDEFIQTNLDVVHTICTILDEVTTDQNRCETLVNFVTDRPGHDQRYAIDASKIKVEIGWAPQETFKTGLRKTVQWYLDNAQWVANVTSGTYQTWIETN